MNITDFIEARLREDESIARQALHPDAKEPGVWMTEHHNSQYNDEPDRCHIAEDRKGHYWDVANEVYIPNAEHMARHDPARVLREVNAKRTTLTLLEHWPSWAVPGYDGNLPVRIALRHMAAVYADHPDYDPTWA
ncbi:DUF6221 family protein [Rhodococcus sp. MSC1_016]|uniref:DUF6221 family protein n=1 Tax=Rhodococcus sp. MSC1_016 TaxID=2909266 RepID=UPI00202F0084|nr:DUF6221 family protein [Rhodococcus sp. MSC1_016]